MLRSLTLSAALALVAVPLAARSPVASQAPAADLDAIVHRLEPAALADRVPEVIDLRLACLRLLSASPAADRVPLIRYTIAYAAWRVAFSPSLSPKDQASLLDDAVVQLNDAIKLNGKFAEAMALLASVEGAQIAHTPELGMTLGPESSAILSRALTLEPDNPRVLLVRGEGLYNTPPEYGGSVKDAETTLRRALQAFDREPATKAWPNWGRFDAHAWLGKALADRHDNAGARAEFTKALEIAPESMWAKILLQSVKVPE